MSHDVGTPVPTSHGAESSTRRGRKAPKKKCRTGRIVLLVLLVLVLALGGTGYRLYSDLNNNIDGIDLDKAMGGDRPEKLPTAGQNTGRPSAATARSPSRRRSPRPRGGPTSGGRLERVSEVAVEGAEQLRSSVS
ncbi:hypothetical protein ACWD2L_18180 [Streptomyces sp. NPDC002754]